MVDLSMQLAIWGIIAGIVSVLLGLLAIAISVYFFLIGRRTETAVGGSLAKIEAQADVLQRLTGRQLDRLTRFVTERQPGQEALPQLLSILVQLPQNITASLQQVSTNQNQQQLLRELIISYVVGYFYTAQTNYWAQSYLPEPEKFDKTNQLHMATRRIIDTSAADFSRLEQILSQVDPIHLQATPVLNLYLETRDLWRNFVRTSADVYVARQKADHDAPPEA